jgi:NDP-sugar pyrophosphorylase family protein
VLAAGAGTRLRPLTYIRPKALCPVDNVPLVDLAIERVRSATTRVAVNVHHHRRMMEGHLSGRVHLSAEVEQPLGTAGALGHLRSWIDGSPTLVVNADAWAPAGLWSFVAGWDGERTRLLLVGGGPLEPTSKVAAALLPWSEVERLPDAPAGLYERSWRPRAEAGLVETVAYEGPFIDCGTPYDYLQANLLASGGANVVGPGAVVEGTLERCVVWPGATVREGEHLTDAIRAGDRLTVLARRPVDAARA